MKGPPLRWETLSKIDANMTRVARLLATEYGYSLDLEVEPASSS